MGGMPYAILPYLSKPTWWKVPPEPKRENTKTQLQTSENKPASASNLENVVLLQQPLHVLLRESFPDVVRHSSHAPHHLAGPVQ